MRQVASRAELTPGQLAQGQSADGSRALGVPALLTYEQAGKILRVGERTLWQMVEDGRIRRVRLGRLGRIDPRDLEAFISGARGQEASGAGD